jgi:hypothetical protein
MLARASPKENHEKQAKSANTTAGRPKDRTVFDLGTLVIVSVPSTATPLA